MRRNPLRAIVAAGRPVVTAWLSIPTPVTAEQIGHLGYDAATLDLQHGLFTFEQMLHTFMALSSTPATPMARVEGHDPVMIGRVLDAGAYGIICPMVETAEQARAFVSACRYAPVGIRSHGPSRGHVYGGDGYFPAANEEILAIAMLETKASVEAIDEIVAVEGLDGIFIGPNDMSVSFGHRPVSESTDSDVIEAIEHIRRVARGAGKIAGIVASDGQASIDRIEQGFNLVSAGSDTAMLMKASRQALSAVRDHLRRRESP